MTSDPQQPGVTDLTGPLVTALPDTSPPAGVAPVDHDIRASGAPGVSLTPGARPLPEFELVKLLGRGGFGEVWGATGPGGVEVALKFIRLGEQAGQVELRSLELMKNVRHPHLLPLFGAWQCDEFLILAMELA